MTTTAKISDFNPAAMMTALARCLLAFLLPTDCLRSLENRPPFHRAFRQYVGNPEAICNPYNKVRQQPDGNDLLCWTGQPSQESAG